MRNIIIILVVVSLACLTIVCQFQPQANPHCIDVEDQLYSELKQEVVAIRCFAETMKAVSESLERDEISLSDAARRVHDAARLWRPRYLKDIQETEMGQAPLERVARNLVGHMQNRAEFNPDLVDRVQELEAELDQLVSENPRPTAQ